MSYKSRKFDTVDIMARASQDQQTRLGSLLGLGKNKGKWRDRKGPNPLTMLGLDRS
ncbi:hypothetical protein [Roseibium album]|uniref:Uncharacterized protein n=1 Tax=Roseibium album TaxID=311410 RepID=A0A0M7AQZ3_9HYPH|nr:hypothetical protein [Roseibium album]CTQ60087.1 hypothetical protein LA5094_02858 [Roseibium album]CTQ77319.1 hypothetical protein LA5095_03917 [Roseibium album]CTQ77559.1 hypothetical protein LA5096_05199 [Roseibium album]